MVSESTMLLVAQLSSSLTLIIGFIAIAYTIKAAIGLLKGDFKTIIFNSAVFLSIFSIGVFAMALYHIMEETPKIADILELIWYAFIFISLIFSIFESIKIKKFEAFFANIKNAAKKKK